MITHNECRRQQALNNYYAFPNHCLLCSSIIRVKDKEKVVETRKRKFCNSSCFAKHNNATRIRIKKPKPKTYCECGQETPNPTCCDACIAKKKLKGRLPFEDRSKGELFSSRKNWQSSRSSIVHKALKKYEKSGLPMTCKECGYSKHVEIAHRKAVASFPDSALFKEINHLDNLVPLCRNHHWEQENGLLDV